MRFVSIDVETANAKADSICQIGMVKFEGGVEVDSVSIFIDPNAKFDAGNVRIHGIDAARVLGMPKFPEIYDQLSDWSADQYLVSHTSFDRTAITQACAAYGLAGLNCNWADSATAARFAWEQFSRKGYGLRSLADHFGIEFRHHDALEDARVAGLIFAKALQETGQSIEMFAIGGAASKNRRSRFYRKGPSERREGSDEGMLAGQVLVFTGDLSLPRSEAADRAAAVGASVGTSVTLSTTMLVVGERDLQPGWAKKSGKHMKAETLIKQGQDIDIIGEEEFLILTNAE